MHKIRLLIVTIIIYLAFPVSAEEPMPTDSLDPSCYVVHDPFETLNRGIFAFNTTLDTFIVKPIVSIYIIIMPKWGQNRVHSFFDNIRTPVTLANNILQGNSKAASRTVGRALVNTFLGFGGLVDFASEFDDLDPNPQGFDDTLATYKFSYGAYFVIPLWGPSTTRGAFGKVVDLAFDPLEYTLPTALSSLYYTVATNVDLRIQYNDLIQATQNSSVDYYSKTRSMYIQYISRRNIYCPNEQMINNSDYENNYKTDDNANSDQLINNNQEEKDDEVQ